MADVLRLQTNVPERIALEYTDGLAVESKFGGDQIMFTLCDGRKTFLPPFVAKKIQNAGIRPNEEFLICKREVSKGNRRTVDYEIDLALTKAPAPVAVPDNGRIHAVAAPAPAPTNGFHASGAARQLTPEERAGLGLNGAPAPAPVAAPARAAAAELRPNDLSAVEFMKLAGRGAIDAVVETESYAKSRGLGDFVFDSLSVQNASWFPRS